MIDVRLLGPAEVDVDGQPLAVDTRKAIALLAYVAVLRRPVSRETLTALLWPDSADHDARGALRRTLSVLKSGLHASGLRLTRSTVELEPTRVRVDLDTFHTLVSTARSHQHQGHDGCADCRARLKEAVAVARGPFMEGFSLRDSDTFDEWQSAEREAIGQDLAGALERLVGMDMAALAWDAAITHGQRWLALDPLHEQAHRALMEAHARAGERTAAVRQYRHAVAILDRDLGVAPLPETTALYEAIVSGALGRDAVEPASAIRADTGRPHAPDPPLIGRAAELDAIMGELGAITADGRLIVLEGEAGIGKTRLANAVSEEARTRGHRVIAARCYEGEEAIPLGPIVALLRAGAAEPAALAALRALPTRSAAILANLAPGLEATLETAPQAPLPSPSARLALLEAIADGLTAAAGAAVPQPETTDQGLAVASSTRPPVIRLDDLQWADGSSLDALAYLGRRLQGRPVLLLLSWRREDLDARARMLVADATAAGGGLLHLERLKRGQMTDLIDAVATQRGLEVAPAIRSKLALDAEGLPLYAVEALGDGGGVAGGLPVGMRDLLRSRLSAVSELGAQVAAAAAVIGRSFGSSAVQSVSGRSEEETVDALEELTRRGIIRESGPDRRSEYDFVHASLREVAYGSASAARQRLLHRRAADAYRTHVVGEIDPTARLVRIAQHERVAGRTAESAEAFRQAGELALAQAAHPEALEHLGAALALGHPDVGGIHLAIAEVRTRLGDYDGAIAAYETAAASATPGLLAWIEHRLGRVHLRRGSAATAAAHLDVALEMLAGADASSDAERSRILADRAIAAVRMDQAELAGTLAEQAGLLAAQDPAAQAEADRILGLLAWEHGEPRLARERFERSLAEAADLPDPSNSIAAANALALVAAAEGDIDEALALADGALLAARRAGERHLQAAVESNLADILQEAGRRDQAMAHLKASASLYAEMGGEAGPPEPGIWMLQTW